MSCSMSGAPSAASVRLWLVRWPPCTVSSSPLRFWRLCTSSTSSRSGCSYPSGEARLCPDPEQSPVSRDSDAGSPARGRLTDSPRAPWKASVVAELAEVIANDPVNAEYRHLVAGCSEAAAKGVPGQFFQLLCPPPAGEQPFLRRPMSIYGTNGAKHQVEFLYKVTGAGT